MAKLKVKNKLRFAVVSLCAAFIMTAVALISVFALSSTNYESGFSISYKVGEDVVAEVKTEYYIPGADANGDGIEDGAITIVKDKQGNTVENDNGYVKFNANEETTTKAVYIGDVSLTPFTPTVEFYFTVHNLQIENFVQVLFIQEYSVKDNFKTQVSYYNADEFARLDSASKVSETAFTNKQYDNIDVGEYKIIKVEASIIDINNLASCSGKFSIGLYYSKEATSVVDMPQQEADEIKNIIKNEANVSDADKFTKVVFGYSQDYPEIISSTQTLAKQTNSVNLSSSQSGIVIKSVDNTLYVLSQNTIKLPADCSYLFAGSLDSDTTNTTITQIILDNVDTSNVTNMTRMFYVLGKLEKLDLSTWDTSQVTNMLGMFAYCSSLKSLDVSNFATSKVTDMQGMFTNCSSLTSLDVSSFDTSNVESMKIMFQYCSSLTSLDVSGLKIDKVTNMLNMFYECSSLTSLDVSEWDTSSVEDMTALFYNCSSLTSLDVSQWDTSNATNMGGMFYGCSSVTSLDVSNWNTTKVTQMRSMFNWCYGLTTLDLSNFDTSDVMDMSYMFNYCWELKSLDVSMWDTSNVINMSHMFAECYNLQNLDVSSFNTAKVTNMSSMFYACYSIEKLDLSNFNTAKVTNMSGMFNMDLFLGTSSLRSLNISSFDTSNVTNMGSMFYYCVNLENLDVSHFNTSKVTNMAGMFYYCEKLTSLDLSNWDTAKVSGMSDMFACCSGLTEILVSDSWSTARVTQSYNGSSTFYGCTSLVGAIAYDENKTDYTMANYTTGYLTLKKTVYEISKAEIQDVLAENSTAKAVRFDYLRDYPQYQAQANSDMTVVVDDSTIYFLSNLTIKFPSDCSELFQNRKLESIGFQNVDTSSVTDMSCMFSACSKLTSLDLSSFDTSSVTDMSYMFDGCLVLTSLDLSNFDTSSVTDMGVMFNNCSLLTSLDLSGWDTSNVTDMHGMFYNVGLTSLDLSSFNTFLVTNMKSMFHSCNKLKEIYVSTYWSTASVTNGELMFDGCTSLVGNISYNSSKTDATYANYTTGYLTLKTA